MSAILLGTLFTTSGLLAIAAIAATLVHYGRAALAVRSELADCSEWREVRVRISEVSVRSTATVLRPDFNQRPDRSSRTSVLPAAA